MRPGRASLIILPFAIFLMHGALAAEGISVELKNKASGVTEKLTLTPFGIIVDSLRQTEVVRFDQQKIFYINRSNKTYLERSFEDVESMDRMMERSNGHRISTEEPYSYSTLPKIRAISVRKLQDEKKRYESYALTYNSQNISKKDKSVKGAISRTVPKLLNQIKTQKHLFRIVAKYFSAEEVSLLFTGFLPETTEKRFGLVKFSEGDKSRDVIEALSGFSKKSGGEYYEGIAVSAIKNGMKR